MLCEKCSLELETLTCGSCGNTVAALGDFCYRCGARFGSDQGPRQTSEEKSPDSVDFSSRVLCSDGTCIGVVDERGICKVCGKPYVPEEQSKS